MQLIILKSKIHNAVVTEANPDYDGSITVDQILMQQAGMRAYEKVLVANLANGNRFETYLIPGPAGSKVICANGGAALLCKVGDPVIIMGFCLMSPDEAEGHRPLVLRLDRKNNVTNVGHT